MSELDEVTQLRALASMQGQRIAELEAQNEMLIDKAHLEVRTTYDSIVVQAWREKLEAVERQNALLENQLQKLSYFTDPHAKGAIGRFLTADEIIREWASRAARFDEQVESLEAQNAHALPNSLLDLIRFMCNVWHKTNDWAINKVGTDILMSYPMVQGTANQMALRKIAMQPYNTENIREAVDWMIAQAAIDGGAMGEGE